MNKIRAAFIVTVLFILSVSSVNAMVLEYDGRLHEYDGSIYDLIVNNELLNPPLAPIIFNDRALVPVREIFEELGAEVDYNMDTRTVEISRADIDIIMTINDNVAYINGEPTVIPDGIAPKLISEFGGETKTMVPVRFISESIGLSVDFDFEHGAILIESYEYEFDNNQNYENDNKTEDKTVSEFVSNLIVEQPNTSEEMPAASKRPLSERPQGDDTGVTGVDMDTDFVMQGVDVSHWQNLIDWEKAKDEIDFAILSIGYGQDTTSQDDAQFARNAAECEKYGIPYGVYIYSYAANAERAAGEADHVLRMVEGCNLAFPIYYDLEDQSMEEMTPEELGEIAKAFCDKIQSAGYEVGIYANTNWWTNKLTDPAFDNPTWYKWVAQYNTSCTYTGKYTMWQYTGSGNVNGIDGGADMNYWYGTLRMP